MGVWGTGLYSGDFAADLRTTIGAVTRLPLDANRLVDILCETEPSVSSDPEDPDHTIFWLVLADQFSKRNLGCNRVRDAALTIIDTSQDIAMHEKLGMTASDLGKRRKTLAELRARLVGPHTPSKPRKTLKEPQPLLMEIGDLLVYPTWRGEGINPYFSEKELKDTGWKPDGWGALLIIETGRAFDFLAWYRPLTVIDSMAQKPNIDTFQSHVEWVLRSPGTCSAAHFKRMQFEKIHRVTLDSARLRKCFPDLTPGVYAAVNDISIANELSIGPSHGSFFSVKIQADGEVAKVPFPSIGSLAEIAARQ
jgi:hypothetical protein